MSWVRLFMVSLLAAFLVSCASQNSADRQGASDEPAIKALPGQFEGRWESTSARYQGASGVFELDNMDQEVRFGGSSCLGEHRFTVKQASDRSAVIVGKLPQPCGDVRIELSKNQMGEWTGTYDAELPDKGKITPR